MASQSQDEVSRRRRVSYPQLESLWEFLNSHRDIAVGYNKSAQAREHAKRMWVLVAESLNSLGEGATKDWKGWSNYWVDYKAKLKKRVGSIRASQSRTGGGPSDTIPLTDIEKKFLGLLGEGFGSGLPNTQVDPFPNITQAISNEPEAGPSNVEGDHIEIPPQEEGPEEQQQPAEEAAEEPQAASRRRTRTRQRRRTSQETTREILIEISRNRMALEQQNSSSYQRIAEAQVLNNEIMGQMLVCLREIVSLLRLMGSRGPQTRDEGAPDT